MVPVRDEDNNMYMWSIPSGILTAHIMRPEHIMLSMHVVYIYITNIVVVLTCTLA